MIVQQFVQESKKQVEAELSEMTTNLDEEDSLETQLKKELIEENNKLDTHETTVKENNAKTKHWKKEVWWLGRHLLNNNKEIGRHITVVTEDTRETEFLFQRLSMALQRGNAVSFQNTVITERNVVAAIYIV